MLCVGSSGLAQDFTPDMQQSDTSSTPLKCCQNTSYHCYKLPLLTPCSGPFHSIRKKQHLRPLKSFAHQNSFYFSILLLLSFMFVLSLDSLVSFTSPIIQWQKQGYPPCKHETDQRANEYHHLVKHG